MIPQQDDWLTIMAFLVMIGALLLDGILFLILARMVLEDYPKRPKNK